MSDIYFEIVDGPTLWRERALRSLREEVADVLGAEGSVEIVGHSPPPTGCTKGAVESTAINPGRERAAGSPDVGQSGLDDHHVASAGPSGDGPGLA